MSTDFAAQRIREFSLWEAFRSAVSPSHGKQHKTLVDRFAYPIGGTGAVYDAIAEQIVKLGGTIHTNTPIRKIVRELMVENERTTEHTEYTEELAVS